MTHYCQEASIHSRETYIPCGAKATKKVVQRDKTEIYMCDPCADHNVRNRGAVEMSNLPSMPTAADLEADGQDERRSVRLTLAEVVALGEKLERLDAEAAELEARLRAKSKEIRQLADRELPDALGQLGLQELTLADGVKVGLKEVVSAGIGDENREQAHGWLRAEGHGDLIKNEVTVTFGKGEDEYAEKLVARIQEAHEDGELRFGSCEQRERVHPQTLLAFIREQLRGGAPLPLEMFKVYVGQVAQVKRPKGER